MHLSPIEAHFPFLCIVHEEIQTRIHLISSHLLLFLNVALNPCDERDCEWISNGKLLKKIPMQQLNQLTIQLPLHNEE
uniref:Candidate secreted effector n=1 Tax=Meloidogyne incognita TaxID=6306 RepID=A0A914LLX8_MELIC